MSDTTSLGSAPDRRRWLILGVSWRWTLYVNLVFAGAAFTGGAVLLRRQPSPVEPRLDIPGVEPVSAEASHEGVQ